MMEYNPDMPIGMDEDFSDSEITDEEISEIEEMADEAQIVPVDAEKTKKKKKAPKPAESSDSKAVPSFGEKLLSVQCELVAKKGRVNNFGHFNYRSTEDILEAVKPLLKKHRLTMNMTDSIEVVGNRVYVRAVVRVFDVDSENFLETVAFAREVESKKGYDEAQITGAASSYARKYALCGMFLIDDSDDPDRQDNSEEGNAPKQAVQPMASARIACKNCGHLIRPTKSKQGVLMQPDEIAQVTNGLCPECFQTMRESRGGR